MKEIVRLSINKRHAACACVCVHDVYLLVRHTLEKENAPHRCRYIVFRNWEHADHQASMRLRRYIHKNKSPSPSYNIFHFVNSHHFSKQHQKCIDESMTYFMTCRRYMHFRCNSRRIAWHAFSDFSNIIHHVSNTSCNMLWILTVWIFNYINPSIISFNYITS